MIFYYLIINELRDIPLSDKSSKIKLEYFDKLAQT